MEIKINLPVNHQKAIYDILVALLDDKMSLRESAINDMHHCLSDKKDHYANLIEESSYDIDLLDIVTDIFADELEKEGVL